MIQDIENKEADGIIAWAPDRISRNSVDGGRIIYLVDQGIIKDLKFPTYIFDSSPHGKFNLSIAFGQAKLYTDAMRENIMRGIRQKIRKGEYPGMAPYGYFNHHKTRTIEPDPETFDLVKDQLEKFSRGETTQARIREVFYEAGIETKHDTMISFSTVEHMLKKVFYYGYFIFSDEIHKGSHKPMISKETYDKIQKRLEKNPKKLNFHNHAKTNKNFLFPGLASCGECGYSVTKEWHQKKSGKIFKYYRCSKKSPSYKCEQKPINENDLAEQIKTLVSRIALPEEWYGKFKLQAQEWQESEYHSSKQELEKLQEEMKIIKNKLERLLDLQLEGDISNSEYRHKKNILMTQKANLEDQISKITKQGSLWFEPMMDFIETSYQASLSVKENNFHEMNRILRKTGLNQKLYNKKLYV